MAVAEEGGLVDKGINEYSRRVRDAEEIMITNVAARQY